MKPRCNGLLGLEKFENRNITKEQKSNRKTADSDRHFIYVFEILNLTSRHVAGRDPQVRFGRKYSLLILVGHPGITERLSFIFSCNLF